MKQRKCPQAKGNMCFDYGECETCVWGMMINRYERKIKRLKEAKIKAEARLKELQEKR